MRKRILTILAVVCALPVGAQTQFGSIVNDLRNWADTCSTRNICDNLKNAQVEINDALKFAQVLRAIQLGNYEEVEAFAQGQENPAIRDGIASIGHWDYSDEQSEAHNKKTDDGDGREDKSSSASWAWWLLVPVLFVGVVFALFARKKKHSKKENAEGAQDEEPSADVERKKSKLSEADDVKSKSKKEKSRKLDEIRQTLQAISSSQASNQDELKQLIEKLSKHLDKIDERLDKVEKQLKNDEAKRVATPAVQRPEQTPPVQQGRQEMLQNPLKILWGEPISDGTIRVSDSFKDALHVCRIMVNADGKTGKIEIIDGKRNKVYANMNLYSSILETGPKDELGEVVLDRDNVWKVTSKIKRKV